MAHFEKPCLAFLDTFACLCVRVRMRELQAMERINAVTASLASSGALSAPAFAAENLEGNQAKLDAVLLKVQKSLSAVDGTIMIENISLVNTSSASPQVVRQAPSAIENDRATSPPPSAAATAPPPVFRTPERTGPGHMRPIMPATPITSNLNDASWLLGYLEGEKTVPDATLIAYFDACDPSHNPRASIEQRCTSPPTHCHPICGAILLLYAPNPTPCGAPSLPMGSESVHRLTCCLICFCLMVQMQRASEEARAVPASCRRWSQALLQVPPRNRQQGGWPALRPPHKPLSPCLIHMFTRPLALPSRRGGQVRTEPRLRQGHVLEVDACLDLLLDDCARGWIYGTPLSVRSSTQSFKSADGCQIDG